MKPIFPRTVMLAALLGLLLGTLGLRAEPGTEAPPRPIEAVQADLAQLDPYAADFDLRIDRLLAEVRAARRADPRGTGVH